MKKVYGVIAALFAAVALLSCKVESSGGGGGGTSEPAPELIGIDFTDATRQKLSGIKVGDTVELAFQELWSDGSTKDVAYNDSDFNIVISSGTEFVTKDGNSISAIAAGSAKISVTYKNYSKDISFNVAALPVDQVVLTSIAIEPISSIAENASKALKVIATYSNKTTKDVTSSAKFETSDSSIAAIEGTEEGTDLKGVKEGDVTITADFEGKTASITVKVYKPVVGKVLSEITIAPANKELKSKESAEFTVTAKYSNGDSEDVTNVAKFSSDKVSAGALEKNKFTAAKLSEDTSVKITATYEYEGVTKTATATITVKKDGTIPTDGTGNIGFNFGTAMAPTKIEITSGTSVAKDGTLTLITKATYSNGTVAEVFPTYESSNNSVATVDGITLKGIAAGTVNITATYTEDEVTKTASVKITVTDGNGGGSGSGSASGGFNFVP